MSGICAVWRAETATPAAAVVDRIVRGLATEAGEQIASAARNGAGVAVAKRFSAQQVFDGARVVVACDADICNGKELHDLVGATAERENATAALIAGLYERFGLEFPAKLRGSFAIVLWDEKERRLIATVDRFGAKRLAYHAAAGRVLIASHASALVSSADVPADVNPRAIANYLNFSVSLAPETIFNAVQRLLPGSMLIATNGDVKLDKYWDMQYGGTGANEAQLSAELESVVEQSVADYCKDDSFERVGAFLSGGTDSSTVVGMMSRMARGRVKAFSIGFEDEAFDELAYADLAAKRFNAQHFTYRVSAEDCMRAVPAMVQSYDEPFGNSSAIPTYFCARMAAQNGVSVLLAGDGGDELFGGNERYFRDKLLQVYQDVPRPLRRFVIEPALNVIPVRNGIVQKARNYVRRSNMGNPQRFFRHSFLCANPMADIFDPAFLESLGGYSVLEVPTRYYKQAAARAHLDRLLYTDVKITLGDSDLPKVTTMSELAGVRTRFPLLDHTVAEFSGKVPAHLKVKGFEKRYLFKRAFRNLLPVEILNKKKHGFGIPVSTWLKTYAPMRELAHDTLMSRRVLERGYFRRGFISELFRNHESDNTTYYGDTLWTFLVLELWHRSHIDERARATA